MGSYLSKTRKNKLTMVGYKAFDKNFKCRDFQFELTDDGNPVLGKKYTIKSGKVKMCESGFHFCEHPVFIELYYDWRKDKTIRFAKIEASGIIKSDSKDKFASSELTIIREIPRDEFRELVDGNKLVKCKGYKVLSRDWKSQTGTFRVGGLYNVYTNDHENYHCFSKTPEGVKNYFSYDITNVFVEVEVLGNIIESYDKLSYRTNMMRITRQLDSKYFLDMLN